MNKSNNILESPADRAPKERFLIGSDFLTELGRIYLEAGLPLAAAAEAALADYEIFDLPCTCRT